MRATDAEWLRKTPIAHRGLHDEEYPENSMPAFVAAANSGFALELDLHMSSDGRLVVFQDADLRRMTGQEGFVADVHSAALTQLRLNGTEYAIPLFEDVLELVDGKAPILAEIKSASPMTRVGAVLRTLIAGYGGALAVQSFDPVEEACTTRCSWTNIWLVRGRTALPRPETATPKHAVECAESPGLLGVRRQGNA